MAESGPEAPEHHEQFVRYRRSGDRALRDHLVAEHKWLAERCARRFVQRGEPYDDLLQVAMLGLFKAIERFDPEQGTPFIAFGLPTVLGELRRYFRDATWSVRVPRRAKDLHVRIPTAVDKLSQLLGRAPNVAELAAELDAGEEQVLEAIEAGAAYRSSSLEQLATVGTEPVALDPAESITKAEHRQLLASLIETLPARERQIIYLRFFEELSQQEIANRIGTSQVHVSRLIRASLGRMRATFDAEGGADLPET